MTFQKTALPFFLFQLLLWSNCTTAPQNENQNFKSNWTQEFEIERPWAGGDYWLNPLQAWLQKDGKLHCIVSGGDRNIVLITKSIGEKKASFQTQVNIYKSTQQYKAENEKIKEKLAKAKLSEHGWVGFQLGKQGEFKDHRDDAVHGKALCAGITTDGKLFIGTIDNSIKLATKIADNFNLQLIANPSASASLYDVQLIYKDLNNNSITKIEKKIHASWLTGLIALTCSQSIPKALALESIRPKFSATPSLGKRNGGNTLYAFSDWELSGEKMEDYPERTFGPIMWTQFTLSNQVLKMTAQFAPLGNDNQEAILLVDEQEVQKAIIDPVANNVLFKIKDWNDNKDHTYAVVFKSRDGTSYRYEGIIKKQPTANRLTVASLSCADDRGFPHQDLSNNVAAHRPDLYAFQGDQLYERVGGYGVERSSILDYLKKWYIWGWSFRELIRNTPTIIIPDDHDVFHGNLWGEGGKRANINLGWGYDSQDSGGYKEPPEFVNIVHRTQIAHLPDPYDPKPANELSVYYTNLNYGFLSIAILGDRQWKSAPKALLPKAEIENGWPQNKSWNAKTDAFHQDAELLGERQEVFLENWVSDWSEETYFKVLVSQSPFCNVATLPKDMYHDKHVPNLPIYRKGGYPPDDRPVADFDSNAWPQNKRDKALKILRKAFVIHFTGDQHLGSTGQYGVTDFGDAAYWISSPAISNLWPRRWFPAKAAKSGKAANDLRPYTGDYEDGFGNKMTVQAIANPYNIDRTPDYLFDRAPGYSIIHFDKNDRSIKMEVWPRWASPQQEAPEDKAFEGWPITIHQQDNYGRQAAGYLAAIEVDGTELIQLYNESTNELVYTFRPKKGTFKAKVFDIKATYTIKKIKAGKLVEEKKKRRVVKK